MPDLPAEALAAPPNSAYHLAKWELETLAGEYLLAQPRFRLADGRLRWLNCATYNAAAKLLNELKAAEEAESSVFCTPDNVLQELQRIVQRQFHWQRGYLNKAQFYRAARLYFGPNCIAHMQAAHGLTPDDLSAVGFAFFAMSDRFSACPLTPDLAQIGVSSMVRDAALALIASPISDLRRRQVHDRRPKQPIAYQRLSLRQTPLVRLGERLHVPLRNLLLMRTTSGLYYDLVGAGGAVRREIGANFERYVEDLLRASLAQLRVTQEYRYGGRRPFDTPDVLIHRGGRVEIVVECKSTKMSFEAQFGERPLEEARRGYDELAKGIFQIWRFCAHARRGLLAETLAAEPAGVLLTLDYWSMLSPIAYLPIFEEANRLADEEGEIELVDRIPVAISAIEDFEHGLRVAGEEQLAQGLRIAGGEDSRGWMLSKVLERANLTAGGCPWPFGDRLGDVLPWWHRTEDARQAHAQSLLADSNPLSP